MAAACELLVPSAARMRPVTDGVKEGFVRAMAICQQDLQVNSVAVHVIDAPDDCIPEWGLGGPPLALMPSCSLSILTTTSTLPTSTRRSSTSFTTRCAGVDLAVERLWVTA